MDKNTAGEFDEYIDEIVLILKNIKDIKRVKFYCDLIIKMEKEVV